MSYRIHKLKTVNPHYQALQDGRKTFEIRFNDRGYRVGDYLDLAEWDGIRFTGRACWRRVTHILTSSDFPGVADGYVCMSIEEPGLDIRYRLFQQSENTGGSHG